MFHWIGERKKQKEKKRQEEVQEQRNQQRYSLLQRLEDIERYDPEGYKGDTKQKIVSLIQQKDSLIEEIMKDAAFTSSSYEEVILALEEKADAFHHSLLEQIQKWEQLQQRVEEEVTETQHFFNTRTFYPADFPFLANTLQSHLTEAKEYKRCDPFFPTDEIVSFLTHYQDTFATFPSIHARITDLLARQEAISHVLTSQEKSELTAVKQSLYTLLNEAKLKEAERVAKDVKKYIIRGEKRKAAAEKEAEK